MQTKRYFGRFEFIPIAAAAILFCVVVAGSAPSFGQTPVVGGYGGNPDAVYTPKTLSAAEELANIIERIYFTDNYDDAYDENTDHAGLVFGEEHPPLTVFGDRVLLDVDSKTVREVDELIYMLSHEGKLPERLRRMEANNARLGGTLRQPMSMAFEDVAFLEFLALLERELEISIWVDVAAFEREDLPNPLDGLITLNVTDLPAACALELALCQLECTGYRFNDGILEIMPQNIIEQSAYTRVYHVADLVGTEHTKAKSIGDLVATLGILLEYPLENCFITSFQEKMIVAHVSQKQHRQLVAVLFAMRHEGRYPPAQQARLDANQSLYAKLQAKISVDFDGMPFCDALRFLKEQTGVTFFVDAYAFSMEDVTNPVETPITLKLQNRSLETVLKLVLRQLDESDFLVWNGVVCIAPPAVCKHRPEPFPFVYPTERLLKSEPERIQLPPQNDETFEWDDMGFSF